MHLRLAWITAIIGAALLVKAASGFAASTSARFNSPYTDNVSQNIREMRDYIDDIRHEVSNHEQELNVFGEKFDNVDSSLEVIRKQITQNSNQQKDVLLSKISTLETKVSYLEGAVKALTTDVKTLRDHANEAQNIVASQQGRIEMLQNAIKSLAEALKVHVQVPTASLIEDVSHSGNQHAVYKVTNGDSLEKIAKRFSTTISALKNLNNLKNDRIIVGQVLKLPTKNTH